MVVLLVAGQPREQRRQVVVAGFGCRGGRHDNTVEPQLWFKSSGQRTDHRRALRAKRRLAVGTPLLRARGAHLGAAHGRQPAALRERHPAARGARAGGEGRWRPARAIRAALDELPAGKTPTKRDWERLSRWRRELDERIATLEAIRGRLTTCIGCGCLSLRTCALLNPADEAGSLGEGARTLSVESLPVDEAWRRRAGGADRDSERERRPGPPEDVKRAGEWVCELVRAAAAPPS